MELIRQYYEDLHAENIIIKNDGAAVVEPLPDIKQQYRLIPEGEYSKQIIRLVLAKRLWDPHLVDINTRYGIIPDGRNTIDCLKVNHGAKANSPFWLQFNDEEISYEEILKDLYRPYPTHCRIIGTASPIIRPR